ncbi:MAG: copper amine oxidase N-terminal domain-containing protein, partial [Moorella sp. (in: Bacteria)]|nr:copper amine oxidase N-terminal domain-containing protein [Moorella sp. (in: firmicutes)]
MVLRKRPGRVAWVAVLFLILAVLPALGMPTAQAATISVVIDGRPLATDVAPVREGGRVLVPMRAIFEALGAKVNWDGAAKTVTASKSGTSVRLT